MSRATRPSRSLLGFDLSRGALVAYVLLGLAWLCAVMSFFLYKGAHPGTLEEQRAANEVRVEDGKEPLALEEESGSGPAIVFTVVAGALFLGSGVKLVDAKKKTKLVAA